jgi:cytosine/adenosine deaminase-related metal-dependent hydrolase
MDLPLLEWLEKYTFPCESKFSDIDFARVAYAKSVRRHLKCGTTFASYFATLHNEASEILANIINQMGQRAFIGKISMDRNSPDFYIEKTVQGCDDAERFVRYVLSLTDTGKTFLNEIDRNDDTSAKTIIGNVDTPIVIPCITPRFVPPALRR